MIRLLRRLSQLPVEQYSSKNVSNEEALLAYITPRLRKQLGRFRPIHPNVYEAELIIKALLSRYSTVKVTDYRSAVSTSRYSLVVGMGESVRKAAVEGIPVYYYASGASARFQHTAVCDRLDEFVARYGPTALDSVRLPTAYYEPSEILAKRIICVGNDWTRSTFGNNSEKVVLVPGIPVGLDSPRPTKRAFEKIEREFLWIGSAGILHKGLNIAAAVARRLNAKLIAIGIPENERTLAQVILTQSKVQYEMHGLLSVGSSAWNDIMNRVTLVIGASISEGMSTSLLTAAIHSVIPISLVSCGIDVGLVSSELHGSGSVESLCSLTEAFLMMTPRTSNELVNETRMLVEKNNSPEKFFRSFSEALSIDMAKSS